MRRSLAICISSCHHERVIPKAAWSLKELNISDDAGAPVLLSASEFRNLADRAHLRIDPGSELEALRREISTVIRCAKTIQALDLSRISAEEAYHFGVDVEWVCPTGDDVGNESAVLGRETLLAEAPKTLNGLFKMPLTKS